MNRWDSKLLFPPDTCLPVREQVSFLFDQQRNTWKLFRNGEAALSSVTTKEFIRDAHRIVVQANPGRSISTNAKVDAESVAERPCFLCPGALPPEERGFPFGSWVLLPNPFPVLNMHLTIACSDHLPQEIGDRVDDLLLLSKELGSGLFVFYNGPRCGASAPDHMHFQACSSSGVPLFDDFSALIDDRKIVPLHVWGRNMLLFRSEDRDEMVADILRAISLLKEISGEENEPMVNIIARFSENRYRVALFPRAKHRSACYFAESDKRLSISPAAIEMAGVVVVADTGHFNRVDERAILEMYREVSLDNKPFKHLTEMLL